MVMFHSYVKLPEGNFKGFSWRVKKTCTAKYSNTKVSIQDFPSMLRGTGWFTHIYPNKNKYGHVQHTCSIGELNKYVTNNALDIHSIINGKTSNTLKWDGLQSLINRFSLARSPLSTRQVQNGIPGTSSEPSQYKTVLNGSYPYFS